MIIRSSSLFGLNLITTGATPTFGDFVNTDYDAAVMERLVRERRRSSVNTLGHGVQFQTIAEKYGATYETPAEALLPSIANLAIADLLDVSATGNWDDFALATGYQYVLVKQSDPYTPVLSGSVVASTVPLTPLTQLTSYTLKVRATGANSTILSKWTSVDFTTAETV